MRERWTADVQTLRRVAFDSNAVIYALEGREPYAALLAEVFREMEEGRLIAVVSTVVEFEVLVYPFRRQDRTAADRFIWFFNAMPRLLKRAVDRSIAQSAALLRAHQRLGAVDALIAATAIEERCGAIIGNDVDMANRLVGVSYLLLDRYV